MWRSQLPATVLLASLACAAETASAARTTDHVGRIYHGLLGPVACQRAYCAKTTLCDACPELRPQPAPRAAPLAVGPRHAEH